MRIKISRFPALSLALAATILVIVKAQISTAFAQSAHFFRITGPAATRIVALKPDGSLVWTNGNSSGVYTVQTCATLPAGNNWSDYVQLPVSQKINTNQIMAFNPPAGMVFIPSGEFRIGDSLDNDTDNTDFGFTNSLPTNVCVSAFYMDKNLVSYSQWQAVYNWAIAHGYNFDNAGNGKGASYPADFVNWFDCVKWCNARSEMEGRTPAYYTNAAQQAVYRTGWAVGDNFSVKRTAGYRLPTEAEWEKAARGGLIGLRFPWGNTISESQANYYSWSYDQYEGIPYDLGPWGYNAIGKIGANGSIGPFESPVGSFAPNNYGLYDMAGNVEEWCWDYYVPTREAPIGSPYLGGSNPCGPNWDGGLGKVLRGGDCWSEAPAARCAARHGIGATSPYGGLVGYGFRCVIGASGFGDAFFDSFSNGLNAANWSVSQTTANLYSVNATQGKVQLAKTAHNPGGTQNVSVVLKLSALGGSIINDFSVQIDFTNAVLAGPGVDQVELRTYYQDGSVFIIGHEYSVGITNYTSWNGISLFPVSATGNSGTFGICRTASQIFGLFDGHALWGQGNTASALTNVTVVLQNDSGSDDATSVTFDNFSLTSASIPIH